MIDLNCHILDETICGPESFAESLEMCRLAVEEGVRTIVATPLWDALGGEPPLPLSDCERKLERLRREMRGALSLKLGFTIRFRSDLAALVEQYGSSLTIGGGRYVLVWLPSLRTPPETEEVWSDLYRLRFSVLVARPECSPDLRRQPQRLDHWVANGAMLQIDAASIIGLHGREVQHFAMRCIRAYGDSVVVSSNARDASARRPSLGRAREKLRETVGSSRARMLLSETPAMIIGAAEAEVGKMQITWRPSIPFLRLFKTLKRVHP